MIYLERSPSTAIEVMKTIDESTTDIVVPTGLLLPKRFDSHPALSLGVSVVSSEVTEMTGYEGAQMWGGVFSEEFSHSSLYITDNISVEIQPHIAAFLALTSYGEDVRLIRSLLIEASRQDKDLDRAIGSTIYTVSRSLEPHYCMSNSENREEFRENTGFNLQSHMYASRAQMGEVMFAEEQQRNLNNLIIRKGSFSSARFLAEIPHNFDVANNHTKNIGSPFALNGIDKVNAAYITREPANPKKPHVCYGCHGHIAPKSLRLTVQTEGSTSGYDHHHLHVSCS